MAKPVVETDLARPLIPWLRAQGWTVRSEVRDCDMAAVRDGELLVLELKRSLTLALVVQAAKRQRLTDTVYLAIPRPESTWRWRQENRGVLHLLRRLELGLLFVSLDPDRPPVDPVIHPLPFTRRRAAPARRAVLEEIGKRSADYNVAGSRRRKLMTAYRESAIRIACFLAAAGSQAPKSLRVLGTGAKTQRLLYDNVYGWFQRSARGAYRLSARGRKELDEYPELKRRFLAEIGRKRAKSAKHSRRGDEVSSGPISTAPARHPRPREVSSAEGKRK